MKNKIPETVYYKVAIGFIFSLLIIWYFSFRLISSFLLPFLALSLTAYLSFAFSFIACLLLVRRSVEIEMKNLEIPFSVVARDPAVPISEEKLTMQSAVQMFLASLVYTFLLGLPLTLIAVVRVFSKKDTVIGVAMLFCEKYWVFYVLCFSIALFITFVFIPSLKSWHWTKMQF